MMMSMGVVLLFVDLFDCLDRDFVLFVEPVIYLKSRIFVIRKITEDRSKKFKFFKKKQIKNQRRNEIRNEMK